MIINIGSSFLLATAILCVTFGSASFFVRIGCADAIQYIGLAIILYGIYSKIKIKHNKKLLKLLVVMVLFSLGIIMQDLPPGQKVYLIISNFILSSIALLPCRYFNKDNAFDVISKSILISTIISIFMAILSGLPLSSFVNENMIIEYGFNGGIIHKNFFAYNILVVIICCCYKLTKRNILILTFSLFLLVLTSSRSSYIILFLFLILLVYGKLKESSYNKIFVGLSYVILIVLGIMMYKYLIGSSQTLAFRFKGLTNYFDMFSHDSFHMIFGNAEMAFRDSGLGYDRNIRSVIGWDGSTELVILNIFIKNGLLGLIAYVIIFSEYLKNIKKIDDKKIRNIYVSIFFTFIVSAFVECFLATITYTYSVFNYLVLCNLAKRNQTEDEGN